MLKKLKDSKILHEFQNLNFLERGNNYVVKGHSNIEKKCVFHSRMPPSPIVVGDRVGRLSVVLSPSLPAPHDPVSCC
jgi:hypothetical protein